MKITWTPAQNASIESFNGTIRAECLNTRWRTVAEARQAIAGICEEHNTIRLHRSVGQLAPAEYAAQAPVHPNPEGLTC